MKKILLSIISIMLSLSIIGCSSNEIDLTGTWEPESVIAEEVKFTIKELEALGDFSLSEIIFIVKEGGKIYIDDGTTSELVDWEEIENGMIVGEVEFIIEGENLVFERNNIQVLLVKVSENEEIVETEENTNTNTNGTTKSETTSNIKDNEILEAIDSDVLSTVDSLNAQYETLIAEVGDTYDGYVENKDKINEFYYTIEVELANLANRIAYQSHEYFRYVVNNIDNKDTDALDDALEEYFDRVYDDACNEIFDEIYNDLTSKLFDQYYNGILSDAFDTEEYSVVSDISSQEYEDWSDLNSNIYEIWSDLNTLIYDYYSETNSQIIWDDNLDIEGIIADLDEPSFVAEEKKQTSVEVHSETTIAEETSTNTEWKEFLVEYEAWVDSYVEFMEKYNENPSDLGLITEYASLTTEMLSFSEKANSIQGELSNDDLNEYIDTLQRITTKLSNVVVN